MVILRKLLSFLLISVCICSALYAADIRDGNIRLVINERTGNYMLYLLNPQTNRFERLFYREQAASFTSVNIDGNVFRLSHRSFNSSFENYDGSPRIIFESSDLRITKVFTFITTGNSFDTNGVMITYSIENISDKDSMVGLRVLIDTVLGEGMGRTPFVTDIREITRETVIDHAEQDRYWISRNQRTSLMGSIANPLDDTVIAPDYIHFANWRRLFNASWNLRYSSGRSFGGDSAVSYIYEPVEIQTGGFVSYTIFLTAEDINWYNNFETFEMPRRNIITDFTSLHEIQDTLNQFIDGQIDLDEQDLYEIEREIDRYR
jgi:hypothetical protein